MPIKSRRGVVYDLSKSDYIIEVEPFTLHFSSEVYRQKFYNSYEEEIEVTNIRSENIYKGKYSVDMSVLTLLRLYVLIEKRGFFIKVNGVEVDCPENLNFVLGVNVKSN